MLNLLIYIHTYTKVASLEASLRILIPRVPHMLFSRAPRMV
jgi:hypothetical protein